MRNAARGHTVGADSGEQMSEACAMPGAVLE